MEKEEISIKTDRGYFTMMRFLTSLKIAEEEIIDNIYTGRKFSSPDKEQN